ncbi:hypothetical protein ECBCE008MS13_5279 [Escherichia coli BCE008_MS-13]|nr:hypothetical protein ECBCE008MS13_5279 [Escherichia coli BCE008_MS-13]
MAVRVKEGGKSEMPVCNGPDKGLSPATITLAKAGRLPLGLSLRESLSNLPEGKADD